MNVYITEEYTNRKGINTRTVFYILNDNERMRLADKIVELERDIIHARRIKKIKRWTKYDKMVVPFLKRVCHFGVYEESEMIDLNYWQMYTLVAKTLAKVYSPHVSFEYWLKLEIDEKNIWNNGMMLNHMNRKRRLLRKLKELGLAPQHINVPY